MASRWIMLIL